MADMKLRERKYLKQQALFYKDLKMEGYITMQVGKANVCHAEAEHHSKWMIDTIIRQDAFIEAQEAEIKRLRLALEFYADKENYGGGNGFHTVGTNFPKIAQATLAEKESKGWE